jgi:hypothetical protein
MEMLVGKCGHVSFQTWGYQLPNTGMLARARQGKHCPC